MVSQISNMLNIQTLNIKDYCAIDSDLFKMHHMPEEEFDISGEYKEIQRKFISLFPQLTLNTDFEIPEWHNEVRMLWVYLYHDFFYNEQFINNIQNILGSMKYPWYSQFECYSPSLKSKQLPSGALGQFIIYKESVIFIENEHWNTFKPKLGV